MRCYWGNPSAQTRDAVIAAAEKLPVPDTDPGLLLILASADPVRLGALVNARVEGIRPDGADPAQMYFVGVASGTVWSWDRSLPFLEADVGVYHAWNRSAEATAPLGVIEYRFPHCSRAGGSCIRPMPN
jgi:hypothetical protein